jgi:hypothetical protein
MSSPDPRPLRTEPIWATLIREDRGLLVAVVTTTAVLTVASMSLIAATAMVVDVAALLAVSMLAGGRLDRKSTV